MKITVEIRENALIETQQKKGRKSGKIIKSKFYFAHFFFA